MADATIYLLGVLMATSSGVLNNLGTVLNKKVVNERKSEEKFFRRLITNPVWLAGLLLQLAAGSVLFMFAVAWIGPALTPGLMALGLIVLAIGSVRIVGEKLGKPEKIGIGLMIIAILFLGLSNLSIDVPGFNYLEAGFLLRTTIFTACLFGASIAFKILAKKIERFRGIFLALVSGFFISLSNFWISILLGTIIQVFSGSANLAQWILFLCSAAILVGSNFYSLMVLQDAFKSGQASNLIPIQQVP
nr:hypothetical protein [Candidatus Sigynarchaeota archaeon]